ncbi:MAG TPA: hypothetical protein VFT98_11425 [Myxococcota bacterium]|nr:hypothetical protein [Myxococcota bacterium]
MQRYDRHSPAGSCAAVRRAGIASLLAGLCAAPTLAAPVELRLESSFWCPQSVWDYGCLPDTATVLSPAVPMGSGDLELDAGGAFVGGTLSLEAHLEDGEPVAAWTRALAPSDLPGSDYFRDPGEAWGDVDLTLTRFVSPDVFAGTLTHWVHVLTSNSGSGYLLFETYSFATDPAPPGWVPLPCAGARLHVDDDGDGEEDLRDRAPFGSTDGSFGTSVDGAGRTIADFCALGVSSRKRCAGLDFDNDEPLRKRPRDCSFAALACRPAAMMPPANPPPFNGPTCEGLPVFSDTDGDGESDLTDLCPESASAEVDENGCERAQFCSQQAIAACRRADFGNDEPGVKRPRDCAPRGGACDAALAN